MTNNAISFSLRQLVIERAQGRCEYCLIHQDFSIYTHEIDHIIAVKHGGQTLSENLALSCLPCNHYKGSDFATLDPNNGEIIRLFNPRLQVWDEHFTPLSALHFVIREYFHNLIFYRSIKHIFYPSF